MNFVLKNTIFNKIRNSTLESWLLPHWSSKYVHKYVNIMNGMGWESTYSYPMSCLCLSYCRQYMCLCITSYHVLPKGWSSWPYITFIEKYWVSHLKRWCTLVICPNKLLKLNLFQKRHRHRIYFPLTFEFWISDSARKRLLKWLH